MPTIARFEDIETLKTARELTRLVNALTENGTFAKDFGFKNQIQSASESVMSNFAEGFLSRTQAQFIEYLGHVKTSAGEVCCQLYIALDLKYLSEDKFKQAFDLADKPSQQLARFMAYLENNPKSRHVREESAAYEI